LHITDIHLDLSYKVGTESECGLPLCCMNTTEMASDPDKAAGHWGNYYCDTPLWMFRDMLLRIKEKHHDVNFTSII
jgi:sphingomyelin phosphodiesterase